jgi:hypothetical protein
MCGSTFCRADGNMIKQSRCRRMSSTLDVRMVLQSLVVALFHDPEWKANGCFGMTCCVPSVWVRFTWQGLKFDSESSVSHGDWDCLILLPHRVTSEILWWVILRYALKGPCLSSHRCLPRMVKGTRTWKLKYEIKDLLFFAFQLRQNSKPH